MRQVGISGHSREKSHFKSGPSTSRCESRDVPIMKCLLCFVQCSKNCNSVFFVCVLFLEFVDHFGLGHFCLNWGRFYVKFYLCPAQNLQKISRVNNSPLVLGPTFPTNPMVMAGGRG